MKRLTILLSLLFVFALTAMAQNNNPCQQVVNGGTSGQVLISNGSGQPPPCKWESSVPGSGTVTSIATSCGIVGGPITTMGTISDSIVTAAHNGPYAVLTGDCGKSLTTNAAAAWTIAQSGTAGFAAGWFAVINNVGSGSLTVTATTSTFYGGPSANISGSVLTVPTLTSATIISDGVNYQVLSGGGGGVPGTGAVQTTSGTLGLVSGTSSNCVLVNGTSAPCDAPGQGAIANVTPVTVSANVTSAQVLQQLTLTAGLLNVAGNSGGVYTYNGSGIYTAAALQTPTLTWTLNACTVSGCGSGTVRALAVIVTPSVVTATNNTWDIRLHIANTATGASGTLLAHGSAIVELTSASDLGTASRDSNTTSIAAIDLTGVIYLQLTVTTSTGNAGNTITEDHSSLEPASAIGPTGATGATGPSGVAWVKHEIIINGAGTYTVDGGGTLTIPTTVTTFDVALFTVAAQSTMSRLFMKHSAILTGITNETSLPVSVGVTSPITNRLLFSNGTLDTDVAVSNTNFLVIGGSQTATFASYGVTVTFSSSCSSGNCYINGLSSGTLDIWVATDTLP